MLAHVYRPRRRKGGKVETARLYRGRFRLKGDYGITEVPLHTPDKQVAEKLLREVISEREREKAGLIAPKSERNAAQLPMEVHLRDFVTDLRALGRTPKYFELLNVRFQRLACECSWKFPGDITASSFTTWRAHQTSIRAKTVNEYLNAANALLNWMVKNGRIPENPLRNVEHADVRGSQTRRRAFTDDELDRLLKVASPEMRLLYRAAAFTGLRVGELQQVVWADLHMDAARPHILVRASTTKNRKEAMIPIHPQVFAELSAMGAKSGESRVFCQHSHPDSRIRKDMMKAGIARIDASGRKLDFHSLRYTFATKLASSGVPMRLAQELMRHSDPRLTANVYTDVTHLPAWEAVNGLKWQGQAAHLTGGTELRPKIDEWADTAIDPQNLDFSGHNSAQVGTVRNSTRLPGESRQQGFGQVLARFAKGPKMERVTGLEEVSDQPVSPDAERNSTNRDVPNTAIDPRVFSTLSPVVAKLVARWLSLPEGTRKAIEALLS